MRARGLAAGLVLVLGATAQSSSLATPPLAEVHVSAYDQGAFDLFSPSRITVRRGGTVTFDFDGPSSHTATDGTGMDLFDSGVVHAGGPSLSYIYRAAGAYAFVCTLHPEMSGQVRVPITAAPPQGGRARRFTVRWAAGVAEGGSVYDVQLRRPEGPWLRWVWGTTTPWTRFVSDAGRGSYRFRARMREPRGSSSAWSDPDVITVG